MTSLGRYEEELTDVKRKLATAEFEVEMFENAIAHLERKVRALRDRTK